LSRLFQWAMRQEFYYQICRRRTTDGTRCYLQRARECWARSCKVAGLAGRRRSTWYETRFCTVFLRGLPPTISRLLQRNIGMKTRLQWEGTLKPGDVIFNKQKEPIPALTALRFSLICPSRSTAWRRSLGNTTCFTGPGRIYNRAPGALAWYRSQICGFSEWTDMARDGRLAMIKYIRLGIARMGAGLSCNIAR